MCNWESWEQLEAKYYIRLCIPGSDLVWPCWIIAALRVCVSKFTHDWHEFLVQINGIKCRPHCWLSWWDTWHYNWQPSCQWWFLWSRHGKDNATTHVIHRSPSVSWKLSKGLLPAWLKACVYMTLCILVPISVCLYWGRHMEGVGTCLNFLETNAAN